MPGVYNTRLIPVFIPLGFIGLYRWIWFIVKSISQPFVNTLVIAYFLYRPIRPRPNMKYTSRHATVLVPTIDSGEEIKAAIKSWLRSDPYEIIFITTPVAEQALWKLARSVDPKGEKVRVITVKHPNKRNQMVAGLNQVKTPITIFADDDVIWPSNMVNWLCAPFSDDQMGGVGSSQRVMPVNKRFTIWEIIAAFRLSLRNIEITATTYIDGGVTCLSGRTAAYRTSILRDPDFQWEFTNEYWVSKYHLHSGDDKFLTRWMHSHRWKTFIQTHREATLLSTFKDNWRFLKQLIRWTRNSWRSDFKSMFVEKYIWRSHPFTAFTMFDKIFNPITLFFGPIAFAYLASKDDRTTWYYLFLMFLAYIIVTRALKYTPHLLWRPQDVLAIPSMILFQYYFGMMKIYCLCTLHVTNWGTRRGADHKEASDITEIYRVHHEVYDDTEIPEDLKRTDGGVAIDVPASNPFDDYSDTDHSDSDNTFRGVRSESEISLPSSSYLASSSIRLVSANPPLITTRIRAPSTPSPTSSTSPILEHFPEFTEKSDKSLTYQEVYDDLFSV
jgi:hypothetical protein